MPGDTPEKPRLLEDLNQAGRRLSQATILFHQAVADRLGLHPTDHKCIDLLVSAGSTTAGELAEATGLTTGAITGVIDRLEAAGFVRREDDPNDRRRVIIRVVPKRYRRHRPALRAVRGGGRRDGRALQRAGAGHDPGLHDAELPGPTRRHAGAAKASVTAGSRQAAGQTVATEGVPVEAGSVRRSVGPDRVGSDRTGPVGGQSPLLQGPRTGPL